MCPQIGRSFYTVCVPIKMIGLSCYSNIAVIVTLKPTVSKGDEYQSLMNRNRRSHLSTWKTGLVGPVCQWVAAQSLLFLCDYKDND